jgi:hypothetical protein
VNDKTALKAQRLVNLREYREALEVGEGRMLGLMVTLRDSGATWVEMGEALGLSPQGAQQLVQRAQKKHRVRSLRKKVSSP